MNLASPINNSEFKFEGGAKVVVNYIGIDRTGEILYGFREDYGAPKYAVRLDIEKTHVTVGQGAIRLLEETAE